MIVNLYGTYFGVNSVIGVAQYEILISAVKRRTFLHFSLPTFLKLIKSLPLKEQLKYKR